MASPYHGLSQDKWRIVTNRLISEHPLNMDELIDVVLTSWNSIFETKIGSNEFCLGKNIFPKPQIMGFFLHELIPLELAHRYPEEWRGEACAADKDIVYIPDDRFSIEVKTSSNPAHIYGNRSYAQDSNNSKKDKSGYYLAVNFQKFSTAQYMPKILLVRFGWLDSSDWVGQKAQTGQQSRLAPEVENNKLIQIYKIS